MSSCDSKIDDESSDTTSASNDSTTDPADISKTKAPLRTYQTMKVIELIALADSRGLNRTGISERYGLEHLLAAGSPASVAAGATFLSTTLTTNTTAPVTDATPPLPPRPTSPPIATAAHSTNPAPTTEPRRFSGLSGCFMPMPTGSSGPKFDGSNMTAEETKGLYKEIRKGSIKSFYMAPVVPEERQSRMESSIDIFVSRSLRISRTAFIEFQSRVGGTGDDTFKGEQTLFELFQDMKAHTVDWFVLNFLEDPYQL